MNNQLDTFLDAYSENFSYAFDNNIMLNWYPDRILQICQSKGSLLELGVGHGFSTNRFARSFDRHVVVEGSASVIQQFRSQHPDCSAEIVESYFEDFETEERFDVIVMGFVLEHVEDPCMVLRHFRKFLGPNGRCFVAVPNGESLHRRIGRAAGLLGDLMELGLADLELGHRRLYSLRNLTDVLSLANYRVVRTEGIFLKPLTTPQLQSLNLTEDVIRAMCAVGVDYPELCCAMLVEAEVVAE